MTHGLNWSPEEDAALLQGIADGKIYQAIGKEIRRTEHAITARVSELRLLGVNISALRAKARLARLARLRDISDALIEAPKGNP